ncbi:MAG: signal peptidase I [Deltaproteobacteria bacterium]|nr:signal peptidase I [Deltaproteobacteria bacterium]
MPPTRRRKMRKEIASLAALLLVMLAARASLADHHFVPSGSMRPAIEAGDRILVDKRAYGLRLPMSQLYLLRYARPLSGDVVVLDSPETGELLVKRVVATEGDEVCVRAGRLRLNGRAVPVEAGPDGLRERLGAKAHPIRLTARGGPPLGPVRVPAEHVLVMGDNRGQSHDGRTFGFVHIDAVLGRALGVFMSDGGFTWRPL